MAHPVVRIIHLADVHFGRNHRFTGNGKNKIETLTGGSLVESLSDDIKEMGARPDFIVISGDLTTTGSRDEFLEVEIFLSELAKRFDLDSSQFLIVPGNHDVFWGAEPGNVSNGDYLSFASRFYKVPTPEVDLPSATIGDVYLLGLDSTRLLDAEFGSLGVVGEKQLREADKKLGDEAPAACIKFLVLHHHLLPVSWVEPGPVELVKSMTLDAPSILAWAQERRFCGIIHGHQHQHFLSTFHFADRSGVPFIVTGGASASSKDLPPQTRNGYQWIEVHKRHLIFLYRELDGTNKFRQAKQTEFVHESSGVFASSVIPSARHFREPSVDEMRALIAEAAAQVLDAISLCYGPGGGIKSVSKMGGSSHTRDGASIIKSLSSPDPVQNRVFEVMSELAKQVSETVGDGTKTAGLICAKAIGLSLRSAKEGGSDTQIASGIKDAARVAAAHISSEAIMMREQAEVERLATTAAIGRTDIGFLIAEAMGKVGKEGIILADTRIAQDGLAGLSLEIKEGVFEIGTLPEWFSEMMPRDQSQIILEQAGFFLFNGELINKEDVVHILETAHTASRPVILICRTVEGDALSIISSNTLKGVISAFPICYPGARLNATLEDISALTGARHLRKESGDSPKRISLEDLGVAEVVKLGLNKMLIEWEHSPPSSDRVARLVKRLRVMQAESDSPYEKEQLQERLARVVGAHGVISISGASQTEIRMLTDLVGNALNVARAGVEEGYVRGGGVSYLTGALHALDSCKGDSDYMAGVRAFADALITPFIAIVESAGSEVSQIKREVASDPHKTFDCWQKQVVDFRVQGPIDSAKLASRVSLLAGEFAARMVLTRAVELIPGQEIEPHETLAQYDVNE